MDITIVLAEKGLNARFSVEQQDLSTYTLRLIHSDGEQLPPLYLKIYKTTQGWTSAFNDDKLIRSIGLAIESANSK